MAVRVVSLKNQAVIADKCHVAERFFERFRGLIGTSELSRGAGMLFPRCNSIHMWFMCIPLDVVFLRAGKIVSVHENVKPWRLLPLSNWSAEETLELPVGVIRDCKLTAGDELCIS
jgi:uncharacterized membrane protein (UPF0127 family)